MSRPRLVSILTHLRRTLGRGDADGLPDAELLDRFVRLHDEAAFELLVWRHERMVFGVCRRLLREEHDAEDAFQAAFLTLARKAASIGRREAVASWLYKVAYRCALRVRESLQRQRQGVVSGVNPANVAVCDPAWAAVEQDELRVIVDEEVQRLPAKYRAAVVLCYLEGKSYQQAADELGCPAGTLSARLHTARERLRIRLTARGVAAPAALAALASMSQTRVAAARLAVIAVQAARRTILGESAADVVSSRTLEIATGVMQAMSASKQKLVAVFLLMGCLIGTTSWLAVRALPQVPGEQRADGVDKPVSARRDGKTATWQECARLRNAIQSSAVHFAPDGSTLATINGERRLCVWNTSNWEQRWQYDLRRYNWVHFGGEPFSPDGRLIHIIGQVWDAEKPGQLKSEVTLLDAANGREAARLPGASLKYSADKTLFAIAEKDGVTLWDARTFRKLRKLKTAAPVEGLYLALSKDGTLACIPTQARCCELWETATGKKRAQLEGFQPHISPDGKTVSTILPGGIVKLWDTANGRERASIRKEGRTGCMTDFSADSKRLLVVANSAVTAKGEIVPKDRKPPRIRPIDVCLYDAATGAELQRLPGKNDYDAHVDLSPDGRTVVYCRLEANQSKREEVVLWDVRSGRERIVLHGPPATWNFFLPSPSGIRNPFFSPDGTMLVTSDPFATNKRLWDLATGQRLFDLPAEIGIGTLYFSPDGQWLAAEVFPVKPVAQQHPIDIRVFHRSARKLPPPVIRGEEAKPRTPPPPPPSPPSPPKSEAARALDAVRQEAQKFDREMVPKFRDIKADPERQRLQREWTEAHLRFGATALKVARDFPADPAALKALEFILRSTGEAEGEMVKLREEALATILRDHRRSPKLTYLLYAISRQYTDSTSAEKALVEIAESSPHRPMRGRAAWVLARALVEKAEMSRLLRALPEFLNDPEFADHKNYLRQMQEVDANAAARSAEEWYAKARDQYADIPLDEVNKETLGQNAEHGLFALRNLAIGKTAPDIEGEDLDGKHFHLKDYRGKVVVLIFCGHWCGPCRQMNPQKQQLVERYAGKPFALLEVNSDEDREAVRRTMRKEKLTWRCWFEGGREGPIALRWGVHSWPTIFLLDGKGVIRFKELRGPMLDRVVDRLVKEIGDDK